MNKKLYKLMNWPLIEAVEYMEESNPASLLAPKTVGTNTLFQMYYPGASEVSLVIDEGSKKKSVSMEMADEMGFFATLLPGKVPASYVYEVSIEDKVICIRDSYAIKGYELSDKNIDKLNTGCSYETYKHLGAHKMTVKGIEGVKFSLWAPNAESVSILATFNNFTVGVHQMNLNEKAGIYEMFIPGVSNDDRYLYAVKIKGGKTYTKLDPYACSVIGQRECAVCDEDYIFGDEKYMSSRGKKNSLAVPMSCIKIDLCDENSKEAIKNPVKWAKDIAANGYTYVEFSSVFEKSAGMDSEFKTISYYAVDSTIGTSADLKKLIDCLHNNDLGVILDWNPAFFASDDMGMREFDGTALYEHLDPRQGIHPVYGTRIFNYNRPQVADFLISNALYWIEEFHIDGLKINNVSSMIYLDYGRSNGEWIANIYGGNENLEAIDFIKRLNGIIKKKYKDVLMIAQEESAYPYVTSEEDDGLMFDYKLNEGFMNDYMEYVSYDPYFRAHHHNELTFSMVYQYSEKFLTCFDNYDKFYSFAGNDEEKLSNFRLSLGYVFTHPGKKILRFNASDFFMGNAKIEELVKDLNKLYKKSPALYEYDYVETGFSWINCIDANKCMISFMRKAKNDEDMLLVVCNFANIEQKFAVGTPLPGKYKEILNTDSKDYGGSNRINSMTKVVSEIGADSQPYNIEVRLAPLSMGIFKYTPFSEKEIFVINKRKEAAIANTRAEEYEALRKEALEDFESAKKEMEEAKARMKEAEDRAQEALNRREIEILKAKKALDEALK